MEYGDQPALVSKMVDWARVTVFDATPAGKGIKCLPIYHNITRDKVWAHYGLTDDEAHKAGMNP